MDTTPPNPNQKVSNSVPLGGGNIPVDSSDPSGPNFSVTIEKTWAIPGEKVSATIDSVGHDSDGGDRVERAIQQTY